MHTNPVTTVLSQQQQQYIRQQQELKGNYKTIKNGFYYEISLSSFGNFFFTFFAQHSMIYLQNMKMLLKIQIPTEFRSVMPIHRQTCKEHVIQPYPKIVYILFDIKQLL